MDYKIVDFNETTGQIIIQVEGFPLFSVDLPLDENNNVPVGEKLNAYLKGFLPVWHVERQNKLATGIPNASEIHALVQPIPPAPVIEQKLDTSVTDGMVGLIREVLAEEGLI